MIEYPNIKCIHNRDEGESCNMSDYVNGCDNCQEFVEAVDYKRLYDIEHRRREAAEAVISEMEAIIDLERNSKRIVIVQEDCPNYKSWQQSIIDYNKIIKEVGNEANIRSIVSTCAPKTD